MTSTRSTRSIATLVAALLGLTALYAGPLGTRFLNDDYLFLEQARTVPLGYSLTHLGALGNYYRPLSRQVYFAVLTPLAAGHPVFFHLINYALFLGALVLLADLLIAVLPAAGVAAALIYFALLPFQRVLLIWVSCSQDLLSLVGVLGALALYRRDRRGLALLVCAAALASKEAALPIAVALVAWDRIVARRPAREIAQRVWPFVALTLAWAVLSFALRGGLRAAAPLDFSAATILAAFVHLFQALLGLDHPAGMLASLGRNAPSLIPLVLIVPLAFAFETKPMATPAVSRPDPGIPGPALATLAATWLAAFGLMAWPVAYSWSSYYYALAAVGGAILVGTLMRRATALGLMILVVAMLWLHAGSSGTRAIAVTPNPWGWTSHLTSFYFERAAALTDSMAVQLRREEPHPPPDARFYFATLPTFAGFQMGNGALVRELYRAPGIESYFYSQFSDSTADEHPCRFFMWDGVQLAPAYPPGTDTFFQVGSDLLLLDREDGALAAFRRGGAAGENRNDLLYWMGWGELWAGRRDEAEQAWTRLGFRDDSLQWIANLRQAHDALGDGDTLASRRHLFAAVQSGVGRPEAHAVLGELLARRDIKYGLLELKVAAWLEPRDWVVRRDLALGLASVQLDDASRRELDALLAMRPALATDASLVALRRHLERRAPARGDVVEF